MRVFVTGGSGFIGSAVVKELISAGHSVLGLARSEASAKLLTEMGAEVQLGGLEDLESLRAGAASSDGVIHLGFIHDFSKFKENCAIDKLAIEALGSGLAGTDRPLIVTSGVALIKPGHLATEDIDPPSANSGVPRVSEQTAFAMTSLGIRPSVVRLPPSVHGDGDHGFVPMLIGIARTKGASVYVGDGLNHWPSVHRLDAAQVYRLALEKGIAGAKYHAIAEEGIPFRDIATVIGNKLNLSVESKAPEAAAEHFGWFTHFASIDCMASSEKTREQLGWEPKEIGLIEDMESGSYFKS
jgi:nucleoside-diphosphate-sugar epimerase